MQEIEAELKGDDYFDITNNITVTFEPCSPKSSNSRTNSSIAPYSGQSKNENKIHTVDDVQITQDAQSGDVSTLNGVCDGLFRDYFFKTFTCSVHPVIILRLLCHKMFGSMVKKKSAAIPSKQRHQGTILEEEGHSSPVTSNLLENETFRVDETSMATLTSEKIHLPASRKNSMRSASTRALHVQISEPADNQPLAKRSDNRLCPDATGRISSPNMGSRHSFVLFSNIFSNLEEGALKRRKSKTRRSGSMDKQLERTGSSRRRSLNSALRSIGDIFMQPLDTAQITPGFLSPPVVRGNSISTCQISKVNVDDRNESERHSRKQSKRFFHFSETKKRSRSQGCIDPFNDDYFSSLQKQKPQHQQTTSSKNNKDSELKNFQRELINLPDFEIDTDTNKLSENTLTVSKFRRRASARASFAAGSKGRPDDVRQESKNHKFSLDAPPTHNTIVISLATPSPTGGSPVNSNDHESSQIASKDSLSCISSSSLTAGLSEMNTESTNLETKSESLVVPLLHAQLNIDQMLQPEAAASVVDALQLPGNVPCSPTSPSRPSTLFDSMGDSKRLPGQTSILLTADIYSPGFSLQVPPSPGSNVSSNHRCIMKFIEYWAELSPADFRCCVSMESEIMKFVEMTSALGLEYITWAKKISSLLGLSSDVSCMFSTQFSIIYEKISSREYFSK